MVPAPTAPAPTLNGFAPSVLAFDAGTSTRIIASQVALSEPLTAGQAGLPTAYKRVPAAGCDVAAARAVPVVVAAVAVAAVIADPTTAAATAVTVSQYRGRRPDFSLFPE
jgi:hypothetical protein